MQNKAVYNRLIMGLTFLQTLPCWELYSTKFLYSSIQCCVLLQLQVPDEALSLVMSMGFNERDAKRALRMNNQDVGGAIDFLAEEKAKKMQKREEDIRRRNEIWWVPLNVY